MQLRFVTNPNGVKELILIETQGNLLCEGDMAGQVAGNLAWKKNTDVPLLLIGHQMLEGRIVQMNKPIGVFKRIETEDSQHLNAVAMVRRKILFDQRPKPIVAAGGNS